MKTSIVLIVCLGFLAAQSQACQRIEAAIRFHGIAYLFFGNQYVGLDSNHKQNYTGGVLQDLGLSFNPDATFILKYNNKEYYFSASYFAGETTDFNLVPAVQFGGEFFRDGLDAAANLNGSTILMKGCYWVGIDSRGYMSWPAHVPQGAPCNPDAALTYGDRMIVFKDDEMYVIEPNGQVQEGMPVKTESRVSLDGITLCKAGEQGE